MRRYLAFAAALVFAVMSASAQTLGPVPAPSSYALPSHTGPIATGARLAQSYGDGYKSVGTRADHIMWGNSSASQVTFCAFSGPGEASNGAATTVKDSLEYPAGTKTPYLFSGAVTGTIPASGGCITSDPLTNPVPNGEQFWTIPYLNNANGLAVNKNLDPLQGAGSVVSTTVNGAPDFTASATPTLSSPGIGITETAITGTTTLPSPAIEGDSRAHGLVYTANGGNAGSLAAAIGAAGIPYLDFGWSGEKAADWNSGHAWRSALANAWGTVNVLEYGFNDANIDQVSLATIQSRLTTAASFLTKPIIAVTWEPATSTSDGCLTTANQSPLPTGTYPNTEIDRTGWNAAVRAAPPAWAKAVFDVAAPVEGPVGKWRPAFSNDCIHANPTGGAAVIRSGAIDFRQFYNVSLVPVAKGAVPPASLIPAQFPPNFSISTSFGDSASWITIDPLGTGNLAFARNGYITSMVDSLFGRVYALFVRNVYGTMDAVGATATAQGNSSTPNTACYAPVSGQTVIINSGAANTGICLQSYPSDSGISTRVVIMNSTATAKLVWPQTGAQIWRMNGSASPSAVNAAATLAADTYGIFECIGSTLCYQYP